MANSSGMFTAILAAQHFGGRSLKVTDYFEVLSDDEVNTFRRCLYKVADAAEKEEDPNFREEMQKLAENMKRELNRG
jgi:hypothetical protein